MVLGSCTLLNTTVTYNISSYPLNNNTLQHTSFFFSDLVHKTQNIIVLFWELFFAYLYKMKTKLMLLVTTDTHKYFHTLIKDGIAK